MTFVNCGDDSTTPLRQPDQMNSPLPPVRDDKGAGLVEYALLIAFIAIVVMVSMIFLGVSIRDIFDTIRSYLP